MKLSINNSPALRYAGLFLVLLLAGLGLAATGTFATPAPAWPALAHAPADTTGAPRMVARAQSAGLSEDDRYFLLRASESVLQQESVSRGVLSQLVYPEVREYAYMILTDEPVTKVELQALAARKGVIPPRPAKIAFRKWAREDDVIDEPYIKLVTGDNEAVFALFEKATRSTDGEIAGYARKALPIIQNHLNTARGLRKVIE
jgi:predicted outer membrane protein